MNEDITLNPTNGASGMQEMQHEELTREKTSSGTGRTVSLLRYCE